jgi:hypothetical protein
VRRHLVHLLTILALTVTVLLGSASTASAIVRASCTNYGYTWVISNQTTCWANAGGQAVTLYRVSQINGGNNAGYVKTSTGKTYYFSKYTSYYFSSYITVTYIKIY